jgi:dienelactone hydrolase
MRRVSAILLSALLATLSLLSVSGTAAETHTIALDAACEKVCAAVDQEIAAWTVRMQEVDTRMLAAAPEDREAAARVVAALIAEKEARKAVLEGDRQAVAAGASPAPPIYLPRPYNERSAETSYADRMIGLLQGQLPGVKGQFQRMSALAEASKKAAGTDREQLARIDRWIALMTREVELTDQALGLYQDRAHPGWYDRANLAAKYDLGIVQHQIRTARAAIGGGMEPWREKQLQAAVDLITAGRTTTEAMAAFHARMTRETPLVESAFDEARAVPETIWSLAHLGAAPACRWLDDSGTVRRVLYRGEPYQGKPTDVFAYYATPGTLAGKADVGKSLPALVLVHGGGDRAFRDWVTFWAGKGYAAIAMDLAGCGPNAAGEYDKLYKPQRLVRGGPGQDGQRKILDINLPLTEQWPYHAVANVILAHSLIRSLPGVDPERTAVAGISWGGYLTCIAAGVDPRFKAAMPFYGCGFLAAHSVWKDMGLFADLGEARARRWTELWDPARYAGQITVPLFAVTGAQDFAYPLESFAKTYALPTGTVQFRITPDMGHGAQFLTTTPEAVVFMDSILRGGTPLPRVRTPHIAGGTAAVQITGGLIVKAQFHYTTADGPTKTREWQTVDATVAGGVASAPLPPGPIALAYFTATTSGNITLSSEPFSPRGTP